MTGLESNHGPAFGLGFVEAFVELADVRHAKQSTFGNNQVKLRQHRGLHLYNPKKVPRSDKGGKSLIRGTTATAPWRAQNLLMTTSPAANRLKTDAFVRESSMAARSDAPFPHP